MGALAKEKDAEKEEKKAGAEATVADVLASQEAGDGAPIVSKVQEEEARVEAEVDKLTEKVAQALAFSEDKGVEAAQTATISPSSQPTVSDPNSQDGEQPPKSDLNPPVGDTGGSEANTARKEKEKL